MLVSYQFYFVCTIEKEIKSSLFLYTQVLFVHIDIFFLFLGVSSINSIPSVDVFDVCWLLLMKITQSFASYKEMINTKNPSSLKREKKEIERRVLPIKLNLEPNEFSSSHNILQGTIVNYHIQHHFV